MKFKICAKINLVVILCILCLGTIYCKIIVNVARQICESKITKSLDLNMDYLVDLIEVSCPGDYTVEGTTIYKGDNDLSDDTIFQRLKSKTGMEYALFYGDECISATLNIPTGSSRYKENLGKDKNYIVVDINGEDYIIHYELIKDVKGNEIGTFAVGEKQQPYVDGLKKLLRKSFLISGIAVIIAIIIVSILSRSISQPINKILLHLRDIKNKDFSSEVETELTKRSDEVGDLANGFADMQATLAKMLSHFQELSTDIHHHANLLDSGAKNMAEHSEQVVAVSQNIAAITTTQANNLIQANDVINDLAKHIEFSANALVDVNKKAHNIGDISTQSSEQMQEFISSVTEFNDYFQDFINQISDFENKVSKVNEIANAIEAISKQTNLLALNASIEAARAGEAGKGFSVVAEEIRELAEQSQNSSQNITAIVNDLTFSSKQLKTNTSEISSHVTVQMKNIYSNVDACKQIITDINSIIPQIQEITENAEESSEHTNEAVGRIEQISALAQNISASCQEVSADSEDNNAIIEEIHHAAQDLNQITQNLENILQSFSV